MKPTTNRQRRAAEANVTNIMKESYKRRKYPDNYAKRYVERFILPHVREGEKANGTEGTPGADEAPARTEQSE